MIINKEITEYLGFSQIMLAILLFRIDCKLLPATLGKYLPTSNSASIIWGEEDCAKDVVKQFTRVLEPLVHSSQFAHHIFFGLLSVIFREFSLCTYMYLPFTA